MIVKPLTAEVELDTTPASLSDAAIVRLYNIDAGDVVITNTTTGASFTMPTGSITFCQKLPTETLTASANVKATSVAFTIS
jgi:hypothetical protein